ncbi:Pseudoazurin precursor [Marinomonas aquimarina]|uniref:Pseudoazurin n=1 Tax=Marinomonas aquimarina TaxID=295068 RepID=A0A1A8TD02_9GAMM|nr:plastocyanin/azurin family copper-binding protein [Marinomonas aquimarina]SBS30650.1 Pseudoazurin precursor [Marinomonas aquimarina]
MLRQLILTTVLASITSVAHSAEHRVQMLNQNEWGSMAFSPSFLQVEVGDTVTFEPTDPGHNAATINYMMPWQANRYRGEIGKPITMTITESGFYGIVCTPHITMGMVMIIQAGAGDISEFKIPKTLPKQAKLRFNAIKEYVVSQ